MLKEACKLCIRSYKIPTRQLKKSCKYPRRPYEVIICFLQESYKMLILKDSYKNNLKFLLGGETNLSKIFQETCTYHRWSYKLGNLLEIYFEFEHKYINLNSLLQLYFCVSN